MFSSLLVANRGEIACRVMRTAHRMGLRTIAVYSDVDAHAPHVAMADHAVRIGPAAPRESYLNIEAVIAAAKASGAEAVHPGYGFLSENAAFADACAKAGLVFVGPPASAIRAMGLKDAAKALMAKAKVPIVPGYHGDNQQDDHLAREAERIGYPVLIKAVAGGGGKGMRRVDDAGEFAAALQGAKREAQSAFGDARVLVEKYVERPRHIEIQVFADSHGNAVYLFERDCSLQRRHQKVIEEAPAPGMPANMRRAMGEAAVACAKAIGYQGAGTVEFIVDASRGLKSDAFYFMEMNTRLQVEHPVTEMITGLDLVEWQLRVAAGEKLPLKQSELKIHGHAVEARLYAEDPANGFLPSSGRLVRLKLPESAPHIRVDAGVVEGGEVSTFYDPMIAKVIGWDETRAGALSLLADALETAEVAGLRSNLAFLIATLRHKSFGDAEIDTNFIARHKSELIPGPGEVPEDALLLAALFTLSERRVRARTHSPWDIVDGWRVGTSQEEVMRFDAADGERTVLVKYLAHGFRLSVGSRAVEADVLREPDGSLTATIDGREIRARVLHIGGDLAVLLKGHTYTLSPFDPLEAAEHSDASAQDLVAPMPGKIIQVLVKAGDAVKRGQAVAILEAMKMEHTLAAQNDGVISELPWSAGDQVSEGAVIAKFTEAAA
ncbi:MAG: biotin/lipoyl-binding protein [Alphaproteobacteria bacterium]|nr:biotin/lipoyl-binding protein [Alphaproteobacteria bacterium]